MNPSQVVVQGVLKPDGTLELGQPVDLPPGKVQITVQPVEDAAVPHDPFWAMMEAIWARQRACGHVCRSTEEIDAEVKALRDEAEEEMRQIERIHGECLHAPSPTRKVEEGMQ